MFDSRIDKKQNLHHSFSSNIYAVAFCILSGKKVSGQLQRKFRQPLFISSLNKIVPNHKFRINWQNTRERYTHYCFSNNNRIIYKSSHYAYQVYFMYILLIILLDFYLSNNFIAELYIRILILLNDGNVQNNLYRCRLTISQLHHKLCCQMAQNIYIFSSSLHFYVSQCGDNISQFSVIHYFFLQPFYLIPGN